MVRYAILAPPVRWSEAEPPGPTMVIVSHDDGDTWRTVAACTEDDADDVCFALQCVADEQAARKAEGMARLMAEIATEQGRDGCPT